MSDKDIIQTIPQFDAPKVLKALKDGGSALENLIHTMVHHGDTDDAIELGKLWQCQQEIISQIEEQLHELDLLPE